MEGSTMEKMKNKGLIEREQKMSYKNFNVAVYCPVGNVNEIQDLEEFDRRFALLYKNVKLGRAYIECFRGMEWATKEQLLKVKAYFESKGIAISGGITTCAADQNDGYNSLCYSSEEDVEILRKAVALNAEVFDELIFDDFYFYNCRCRKCIEQKGTKSWKEFRLEKMKYITEEVVMKTAKSINPEMNVIIKYPQWFEVYNETGYDLTTQPQIADTIYTGTETRNPDYAGQHLPKYLSYFVMRYLESAAPGRNLGGWFDPYECTYNLTSYLEQGYLTLFAKAKEVTLFCLGSLIEAPDFRLFPAAVGEMFEEVDEYLSELGNPIGVAAYRPGHSAGEDNLHSYLGMCGIPFEAHMHYPEGEKVVFLAESAADDGEIVEKMKDSLMKGCDVVVTSGFVEKLGEVFQHEFMNVSYTSRKAIVSEYAGTDNCGINIFGKYQGEKPVLIPQMSFCTNDVWELAAGYGTGNNFPIVLRCTYAEGHLYVVTIPDNMGDLYHYPAAVLSVIRKALCAGLPVHMEGNSGIQMFLYDNKKLILRSDVAYYEHVTLHFKEDVKTVKELTTGRTYEVKDHELTLQLSSCVNYVLSYM